MNTKTALKRTKIVATLGPVSQSQQKLEEMIRAGLNVARFNFSHGEHEWHAEVMKNIRAAASAVGVSVAALADLQGPRIRTHVEENIEIKKGEIVRICDIDTDGERMGHIKKEYKVITIDCPDMVANLEVGHEILIEDGLMSLKVIDITDTHAVTEVLAGGLVKDHKGVNIPDAEIPLPSLTTKDMRDLTFALSQGVDYIAISFVRSAQDIIDLRSHIKKILGRDTDLPKIVAKIERKEALKDLDEILAVVDAVMVARGDLGIEANPAHVTLFQKDIVAGALAQLKPVIVATQMLASMEHNPRPTRAEVADVTNAVIDKSDATMLSAESTVGDFPVETIATMASIAMETEASEYDDPKEILKLKNNSSEARLAQGVYELSRVTEAAAIMAYSETGYTARLISHFRPQRPIIVATPRVATYRSLALIWGVIPVLTEGLSREEALEQALSYAKSQEMLHEGESIVKIFGSTKDGHEIADGGSYVIA